MKDVNRSLIDSVYMQAVSSADFSSSFLGTKGTDMLWPKQISHKAISTSVLFVKNTLIQPAGNLMAVNLNTNNFSVGGNYTFTLSNVRAVTFQGASMPIGSSGTTVNFNVSTGISKNSPRN